MLPRAKILELEEYRFVLRIEDILNRTAAGGQSSQMDMASRAVARKIHIPNFVADCDGIGRRHGRGHVRVNGQELIRSANDDAVRVIVPL